MRTYHDYREKRKKKERKKDLKMKIKSVRMF